MKSRLMIKLAKGVYLDMGKARSHKYVRRIPDGKGGWRYLYETTIKNKFKEDKNEFGESNSIKIIEEIAKTRNEHLEHSSFYDKNGNKIFSKIGTNENIKYSDDEMSIFSGCRLTIHNHNNGSSFSAKDLIFLLKTNIQELRVFGTDNKLKKTNFYIKKTTKATDEKIKDFYEKLLSDIVIRSSQLKLYASLNNVSIEKLNIELEKYAYMKFNEYNEGYYDYGKY